MYAYVHKYVWFRVLNFLHLPSTNPRFLRVVWYRFERHPFQGKEGPKIPLSDVITILPPKEDVVLEATPNFG